jgi:hypothetical protein
MEKKMFVVSDNLRPVLKALYDTLLYDCEKDIRVHVDTKRPVDVWFMVAGDSMEGKDGILRVNGSISGEPYRFYGNSISACFEVDNKRLDAEQHFYLFLNTMAMYRMIRRLPPMDTRIVDGLDIGDSPPINENSYQEIPPGDPVARLAELIGRKFQELSFTERHGRFCYFVYSNPGGELQMMSAYAPQCRSFIDFFKTAFPCKNAQLFAVRWAGTQRLFFVADGSRLYCCSEDNSREFLNQNFDYIFKTLSNSPVGKL